MCRSMARNSVSVAGTTPQHWPQPASHCIDGMTFNFFTRLGHCHFESSQQTSCSALAVLYARHRLTIRSSR
jgi:hypothetical protein